MLNTIRLLFIFASLAVPAVSHAWTLSARIASGTGVVYDGSTAVIPGPGYVTVLNTQTSKTLRVTPAAGAAISQVLVDGKSAAGVAAPDGYSKDYTAFYNGTSSHSLTAYFTTVPVTVTSVQVPNGVFTVQQTAPTTGSPTTGNLTVAPGAQIKVTATPSGSYRVKSISIGSTEYLPAAPLAAGVSYSVAAIPITAATTVSAAYSLVPSVSADLVVSPSFCFPGDTVTFDASRTTSNDTGIAYAFTITDASGATVLSLAPGAAYSGTFVPTAPSSYTVTVTATTTNGATASRSASFLVGEKAAYETQQCTGCHVNSTPEIVSLYNASPHAGKKSCQDCHTFLPHGTSLTGTVCMGCHHAHAWPSENICLSCHSPHNPNEISIGFPHQGNFSTAQYATRNLGCSTCHSSAVDKDFHIYSSHRQWARSGKANPRSPSWIAYDFKTRGTPAPATASNTASDDCVRCHTTTGYINFVTSGYSDIKPWGISGTAPGGDRTREMIACNVCHNTPFDDEFTTRGFQRDPYDPDYIESWGLPTPSGYFNYSSPATKKILIRREIRQDIGVSNLCVPCHIGKGAGATIKAVSAAAGGGGTGAFWRNVDFIEPHGMGAAGIVYHLTGYAYRSSTAYENPASYAHGGLGDGERGNCVTCHMDSDDQHSFSAVKKSADGAIVELTATLCLGCHQSGSRYPLPDAAALEEVRAGYRASLQAVAELLAAKGIYFNEGLYPYFFTTPDSASQSYATRTVNWDAGAPVYKGVDVMGAAFNLKLLQSDAGCWAHNSSYTKRLLYDTIDYLEDGVQDGGVALTLQDLPLSPSFTQTMKERAGRYLAVRP